MDFEEFVTLLGPKLTAAGMPDKFHGTDFDSVFWKVPIIQSLIPSPIREKIDSRITAVANIQVQKHLDCATV